VPRKVLSGVKHLDTRDLQRTLITVSLLEGLVDWLSDLTFPSLRRTRYLLLYLCVSVVALSHLQTLSASNPQSWIIASIDIAVP